LLTTTFWLQQGLHSFQVSSPQAKFQGLTELLDMLNTEWSAQLIVCDSKLLGACLSHFLGGWFGCWVLLIFLRVVCVVK
jgi:hypothetical protein